MPQVRSLIFILGDQLNLDAPAFEKGEKDRDIVVMAEASAEVERYPNHIQRVVLFFSAMRHFREQLVDDGWQVVYQEIGDKGAIHGLVDFLAEQIRDKKPEGLVLTEPGRYDLEQEILELAQHENISIDIRSDTHFFCSRKDFREWAEGRKSLVLEYFYREMRKQTGYLMSGHDPEGGEWNYDQDNRDSFGKEGPEFEIQEHKYEADEITRQVIEEVESRFPELYGSIDTFDWPVTPAQARQALDHFVENHLPHFGSFQDAMWTGEPFLYHSRLSSSLNLKLLDPRDAIESAIAAYEAGDAPIHAVEGFVRQILGWREFIRGIYWLNMPDFAELNALEAEADLPAFFWTADTDMNCLKHVIDQLLDTAYAHHIQRLMVAGLFTLLYGVQPKQVHDWFMALYIDSVEWVTMPNTIGMSQFADDGIVGTKPYSASGKYISRMSNYCDECTYDPDDAVGEKACPFTTLYWDFLDRHRDRLKDNRRMNFQLHNLKRKSPEEMKAISERVEWLIQRFEKT